MTSWALLAPGPSATVGQARMAMDAGYLIGAVGNAFELVERPDFIAATDSRWWRTYPQAKETACRRYTMHTVPGCKHVRIPGFGVVNSGVLALECAKREGATRILLMGFDMHGSHFFGPYTNGLGNTSDKRRVIHLQQYAAWAKANQKIEVINCTPGSALKCFPSARLEDALGSGSLPAAAA